MDCTRLFDHTQRARDIFRSLTAGSARAVTERYLQDAIETRIAGALMLRGETPARTRSFVPRFVASTLLTLIAWSIEQTDAPTPEELQSSFRSLVGRALGSPKI